jgi:translation initiation factor IF-3
MWRYSAVLQIKRVTPKNSTNFVERSLTISKNLRVNERIRVPEVRVIDENGEQAGVMKTRDAMALARQRNLDLVEVAPNAQPPVCRLLDYGKYRYEQTKKERDARKTQKVISIKEVRLRPKIDDHDLETKGKQARGFLEEGHKVKMTVLFRGRELAHTDIGRDLLNQMSDLLKDAAVIEQPPKMEGKNMTMLLSKQAPKGGQAPRNERGEREHRPARPQATEGSSNGQSSPAPAVVSTPAERAEA